MNWLKCCEYINEHNSPSDEILITFHIKCERQNETNFKILKKVVSTDGN